MDPLNDGRQSQAAVDIRRGAARCLLAHGFAHACEVTLATSRRADILAIHDNGEIWIVEIKSSLADFRADQKWRDYRVDCDRLFFAVAPDFPREVLPEDAGMIIADRYGAEILRPAPEHRMTAARRKAVALRFGRLSALRLHALADPELGLEPPPRSS